MSSVLFQFEADFVDSLRCIPMAVRLKLDLSGVKLKLKTWSKMDMAKKKEVMDAPCETHEQTLAFRDKLIRLEETISAEPASLFDPPKVPAWENTENIPSPVLDKLITVSCPMKTQTWRGLTSLQRFALLKLSQSGHEGKNFALALREFGIS